MSFVTIAYLSIAYVIFRIAVFHADRSNLTSAARHKSIRNPRITWAPFAPGWLFERGERHYRVEYTSEDGTEIVRYCKVGFLTGIFWRS
ncbi:hypothetical protein Enr13x_75730 [Stieleria neptunia]|uniref:Uncharacterized protein n=1 Tax=Stieleria neptunia TaxID=2527979 RepID=A0A518I3H3_9BACT|nr:hypothetical protein Enr13x_75730 [Stieleria neptunia]